MSATIASLMQSHVQTVAMDDTVAQVEAFLVAEHRSWVPVTEGDGTVVGVISTSDVLQFHAQQRDAQAVPAWQLCTYKPVVVPPQAGLAEVAMQMVERHIHHVVVAEGTQVRGVVSSLDFVARFVRHDAGP
ncbi:MAG: CBS domain-containing protein [Rubrivivax sp.]|nr:CBS domain-containing protein [Rubrivivax sp.]